MSSGTEEVVSNHFGAKFRSNSIQVVIYSGLHEVLRVVHIPEIYYSFVSLCQSTVSPLESKKLSELVIHGISRRGGEGKWQLLGGKKLAHVRVKTRYLGVLGVYELSYKLSWTT